MTTAASGFTGKERDVETGLDYFLARYFSGAQGRFTSADSTAYSKMLNPQSWNLYAYSFNNPLRYTDPDGHEVRAANCYTETDCQEVLSGIRIAVGAEAGKRVKLTSFKQRTGGFLGIGGKEVTRYKVEITGDVSSFKALGENASRLADLVGPDTPIVDVHIANQRPGPGGNMRDVAGGFSDVPNSNNVYVRADPSSFDKDTAGFIKGKFGTIPGANFGETMAHELLGHTWAHLFGGADAGTLGNLRQSVLAEDHVRRTDPERGLKTRHGGREVISQQDLDRLKRK